MASSCSYQHRPDPLEAVLCYKRLWTVEQTFRTANTCSDPADLP